MRRSVFVWLAALACLLTVFHSAAAQDEEQKYEISNFDVTLQVRPDGTYEVEETLTYDFEKGTFTYAYRVLDTEDASAIRDVQVTSRDATVDSVGRVGDDGDVRVRWSYPERSAPATFRLQYVIEGALLERGDRNVVARDVLDAGATVPTRDVDVRVTLPTSFDLTPDSVSVDPAAEGTVERSAGRVVAAVHRNVVGEDDEYPVEVSFPKRLPGQYSPMSGKYSPTPGQYSPTMGDLLLGLFLFLLAVGGGLALNLRWKGATAERTAKTPPRDVSLPEGGVLLEKSATPLFTAALFDLARRGHLTLQHDEEESWLSESEVVRIDLHPSPDDLSDFEAGVVDQLDGYDTVREFWTNTRSFRREQYGAVRERVTDAEWMTPHRTRSTLFFVGAAAFLIGGLGLGVILSGLATVLVVGAGLGGAIGALLAGGRRYTFTEAGAQRASALRSYLDHEKDEIDRLRDIDPVRAAERLTDALPWLVYHDDVSSAWLEEVEEALADASSAPDLPDGFVSLTDPDAATPVAAFLPVVTVMGTMESSGAVAAGAAAGGAAGAAGGAAGGGAAGAG